MPLYWALSWFNSICILLDLLFQSSTSAFNLYEKEIVYISAISTIHSSKPFILPNQSFFQDIHSQKTFTLPSHSLFQAIHSSKAFIYSTKIFILPRHSFILFKKFLYIKDIHYSNTLTSHFIDIHSSKTSIHPKHLFFQDINSPTTFIHPNTFILPSHSKTFTPPRH